MFVVPHVIEDVTMLVHHYPELVDRLHSLIYNPNDPLTSRLPAWMRDEIANAPTAVVNWVKTRGLQNFGHSRRAGWDLAAVAVFVVVPVVTAYLLLDLENLKAGLSSIIPQRAWRATLSLLAEIDAVIGGFVRGQLLVAQSSAC